MDTERQVVTTEPSAAAWSRRRDWWLLPLIFCMTMVLLLAAGETTARLLYQEENSVEPCERQTPDGRRYPPMCTSHTKVWEGPWITQHFNDCGYRTAESCAPRPAGSLRVAVVGSSTARGALVNYPDSFAARASAALSKQCGALVDFQNLATEPDEVNRIDRRIPEALALKPAAIIMAFGPYDVAHFNDPPAAANAPARLNLGWLVHRLRESRLFMLMEYYLYRDPAFQVRAFLLNGDPADYVRAPLTAAWEKRVADFGELLGRIATASGHVPVLLFYLPERAQAALAATPARPPGIDPFVLQAALARTAARHGVAFHDATPAFASASDFESLFYLTDGHPREGGHAAIAQVVDHALLGEPAFAACSRQQGG